MVFKTTSFSRKTRSEVEICFSNKVAYQLICCFDLFIVFQCRTTDQSRHKSKIKSWFVLCNQILFSLHKNEKLVIIYQLCATPLHLLDLYRTHFYSQLLLLRHDRGPLKLPLYQICCYIKFPGLAPKKEFMDILCYHTPI